MKTMTEYKIIRYKIMDMHREYVRAGLYQEAKLLLILLRRGRLSLGLGDKATRVEHLLENLGLSASSHSRNWDVIRFHLPKEVEMA